MEPEADIEINGYHIHAFRVNHNITCYGYTVEIIQLANQTRVHLIPPEFFTPYHAVLCAYAVLAVISNCYPLYEAGYPRVTHPSAAQSQKSSSEESNLSLIHI